uniref:C2H2-type domain-containing protein n=1 Tax=Anopheles melas TaxID=34690 RepID=A0A182TXX9_9DIPT
MAKQYRVLYGGGMCCINNEAQSVTSRCCQQTCSSCEPAFERDDTLLAHRNELHSCEDNVHEKGRCRYKCVICSKSFQEEKELRTHFKLHEADDCPFQCGMCGILNLNHT